MKGFIKEVITLFLIASFIISLSACANRAQNSSSENNTDAESEESHEFIEFSEGALGNVKKNMSHILSFEAKKLINESVSDIELATMAISAILPSDKIVERVIVDKIEKVKTKPSKIEVDNMGDKAKLEIFKLDYKIKVSDVFLNPDSSPHQGVLERSHITPDENGWFNVSSLQDKYSYIIISEFMGAKDVVAWASENDLEKYAGYANLCKQKFEEFIEYAMHFMDDCDLERLYKAEFYSKLDKLEKDENENIYYANFIPFIINKHTTQMTDDEPPKEVFLFAPISDGDNQIQKVRISRDAEIKLLIDQKDESKGYKTMSPEKFIANYSNANFGNSFFKTLIIEVEDNYIVQYLTEVYQEPAISYIK